MTTATRSTRSTRSGSEAAASPAKRLTLADTLRKSRQLPSRIVLHGQGGIGKTSWATQLAKPYFLLSKGETGLETLIDAGLAPEVPFLEVGDWVNTLAIVQELTDADHDYKTLVMDTGDGFEKLANYHVCQTDYKGDFSEKGFEGYQRGYKSVANGPWAQMLIALDKLREVKRMGIVVLCHTGIKNFANPNGADYNRFEPAMARYAWELMFGWADMVLFAYREVVTEKGRGDSKAKGHGGSTRVMLTDYDAVADAKNRHNLPSEILMGDSATEAVDNFKAALAEGRRKKEVT